MIVSAYSKGERTGMWSHATRIVDEIVGKIRAVGEARSIEHYRNHEIARVLGVDVFVVKLFVAIEDKRYWLHPGIDPIAIVRAGIADMSGRGAIQGGSTIPEQLEKRRLSARPTKSVLERSVRAVRAALLVQRQGRAVLINRYLREVYLGRNHFGVQAAARGYFGVLPENLSAVQAFFLAERPALPNRWRAARVRNILERPHVRAILGEDLGLLADCYGRVFGETAAVEISTVVGHVTAKGPRDAPAKAHPSSNDRRYAQPRA